MQMAKNLFTSSFFPLFFSITRKKEAVGRGVDNAHSLTASIIKPLSLTLLSHLINHSMDYALSVYLQIRHYYTHTHTEQSTNISLTGALNFISPWQ